MLRLSELNWPRILFAKSAAIVLGMASVLSVFTVMMIHFDLNLDFKNQFEQGVFSIFAAASALGFILLGLCMALFWLRCDSSTKAWKTIWFLILLFGSPFGSAALYYWFVYLPIVRRSKAIDFLAAQGNFESASGNLKRFGPFRRSLLLGWCVLTFPIIVFLILPKNSTVVAATLAVALALWSLVVVLEAVIYGVLSFYRRGTSYLGATKRRSRRDS